MHEWVRVIREDSVLRDREFLSIVWVDRLSERWPSRPCMERSRGDRVVAPVRGLVKEASNVGVGGKASGDGLATNRRAVEHVTGAGCFLLAAVPNKTVSMTKI